MDCPQSVATQDGKFVTTNGGIRGDIHAVDTAVLKTTNGVIEADVELVNAHTDAAFLSLGTTNG